MSPSLGKPSHYEVARQERSPFGLGKIKVGVLRGGPSHEYDVSLDTGSHILEHLDPDRYEPSDIFISKTGDWHLHGTKRAPEKILNQLQLVINGLHGHYGEDGQVQQLLDQHAIPYTGATALPSNLAMNKHLARKVFTQAGLAVPEAILVTRQKFNETELHELTDGHLFPFVVKPLKSGSSFGITIARNYDDLRDILDRILWYEEAILLEEYIRGREATVNVIDGFRGQDQYVLPVIEIIKSDRDHFDYKHKYELDIEHQIPGNLSRREREELENATRLAHRTLGLRHYSQSDFMITPSGKVYILETNSLPGLTKHSLLPQALTSVGSSMKEFLDHLVHTALKK